MSEQEPLTPEVKAVEAALASLRPAATTVSRDRIMFEAGRAAAKPRRAWAWPAATAACAAAAIWLGFRNAGEPNPFAGGDASLAVSREPTAQETNLPPGSIAAAQPSSPRSPDSYLYLRQRLAAADLATMSFSGEPERSLPPASPPPAFNRAEWLRRLN